MLITGNFYHFTTPQNSMLYSAFQCIGHWTPLKNSTSMDESGPPSNAWIVESTLSRGRLYKMKGSPQ